MKDVIDYSLHWHCVIHFAPSPIEICTFTSMHKLYILHRIQY